MDGKRQVSQVNLLLHTEPHNASILISETINDPTFIKRITADDEAWFYEFEKQWRFKDEPESKKTEHDERAKGYLLAAYLDAE